MVHEAGWAGLAGWGALARVARGRGRWPLIAEPSPQPSMGHRPQAATGTSRTVGCSRSSVLLLVRERANSRHLHLHLLHPSLSALPSSWSGLLRMVRHLRAHASSAASRNPVPPHDVVSVARWSSMKAHDTLSAASTPSNCCSSRHVGTTQKPPSLTLLHQTGPCAQEFHVAESSEYSSRTPCTGHVGPSQSKHGPGRRRSNRR